MGVVLLSSPVMPKNVEGNVLSLIANKANKGQAPTSALKTWYDQSKIKNSISYSNGVPNPTFVSKTNWSSPVADFVWTILDGVATITHLGSTTTSWKIYITGASLQVISGRKYYVREWMKASAAYQLVSYGNGGNANKTHTGSGNYELLSLITTATATGNSDFRFLSTATMGDISATPCLIKEPMIIDLTALGLDHLSVAQCDELFSFTTLGASATLTRYNPQDWAQWSKSYSAGSSVTANSNGITVNVYDAYTAITIPTSCKPSTKYGFLINVISNNLSYDFLNVSGNVFAAGGVVAEVGFTGMKKLVLTSLSTIVTNSIIFKRDTNEASLKSITLKDIRVFDLTANPTMDSDFTTMSADELNAKYPMGYGEAVTTMANDCTINNTGGTATSGFNKVAVVNGKGDNVVYSSINQEGNFTSDTNWTANTATGSVSNNIYTLVSGASLSPNLLGGNIIAQYPSGVPNGNRIYIRAKVNPPSLCTSVSAQWRDTTVGLAIIVKTRTDVVASTPFIVSGIATLTSLSTNPRVQIIAAFATTDNANGKSIEISEMMYINLSDNTYVQALEAKLGRVLTSDECDRLFAFTTSSSNVVVDVQYALSLDGTDDYGAFFNTPSLDITTNEFALACTFRVAVGAADGSYLISRASSNFVGLQYGIYYGSAGTINLALNAGASVKTISSILTNVWYNIIFYKNSSGLFTYYLNKITSGTYTYANALVSKPNMKLGAVSTVADGSTNGSRFKGDIASQNIYQAPTLDINKIIKAETNIAKLYTGVS